LKSWNTCYDHPVGEVGRVGNRVAAEPAVDDRLAGKILLQRLPAHDRGRSHEQNPVLGRRARTVGGLERGHVLLPPRKIAWRRCGLKSRRRQHARRDNNGEHSGERYRPADSADLSHASRS
jgi:hypothetical protein